MSKTSGILIIGGGIAGIQAALEAADQSATVYLVERGPSIGGHMAMLNKTFPFMDCATCILTPKMAEVATHPNIKLLAYSELQEVKRNGKGFDVKVLKKPRFIDETKCISCGNCAQHCPVEVPNEFDMGLSPRKAIYIPFPRAVPSTYTIDDEHCLRKIEGIKCGLCERVCPMKAVNFDQKPEIVSFTVGAVIVATGFTPSDAPNKSEYGYGRYPNVITNLELERLLSDSGPTWGHVMRLSDGHIPKRVAFIPCVGIRDNSMKGKLCSQIYCMSLTKNAILLKEHIHDVDVTVFHSDIQDRGDGFKELYRRAKEEFNVHYLSREVAKVIEEPGTGNLIIHAYDTNKSKMVEEKFDMVVLSVALDPSTGISMLSKVLDLPVDECSYIKTNSITTKADGIFVAGAVHGPKDISDSVADAREAVAKALTYVNGDRIRMVEPIIDGWPIIRGCHAVVNENLCSGCGICVALCPYDAAKKDKRGIATVRGDLCKGCGTCAASCPERAIKMCHFTDEQIVAQAIATLGKIPA